MSALPTTSSESLIQYASPLVPPSVPRSCNPRWGSQRKGCQVASPRKFEVPATLPRLLRAPPEPAPPNDPTTATVPPNVPRSRMVPLSQRNGCWVGIPVVGFGVELLKAQPATCPV